MDSDAINVSCGLSNAALAGRTFRVVNGGGLPGFGCRTVALDGVVDRTVAADAVVCVVGVVCSRGRLRTELWFSGWLFGVESIARTRCCRGVLLAICVRMSTSVVLDSGLNEYLARPRPCAWMRETNYVE